VGSVLLYLLGLLDDPRPGKLKLAVRLAGGRNRDDLPIALVQLAAPCPVQTEVAVTVELIHQCQRWDYAVRGPVVGGVDLNPPGWFGAEDSTVALERPEPDRIRLLLGVDIGVTKDEALGLPVQNLRLLPRWCADRDKRAGGEAAVVEGDEGEERGLAVALGDDQPDLSRARKNVGDDLLLEWL
jgi:hypothetical protein